MSRTLTSQPSPLTTDNVRMLLPGAALFLIDIFRRFDLFRQAYDQSHLEAAAASIGNRLGAVQADGVMSDALLVDNEMRLRIGGRFAFRTEGSPAASEDEASLVRMIAALQGGRYRLAAECALALDIVQSRTILILAGRLADRLRRGGLDIAWTCPERQVEAQSRHAISGSRLRIVPSG